MELEEKEKMRDDVDRILSASAIAINSLPKNHEDLVSLGKIGSQRNYFRKLYFEVGRDPNLISFARIIRELFVIVPQDIELENKKQNPQLYTTDNHGNIVRKKSKKGHSRSHSRSSPEEQPVKFFDTTDIKREALQKAADWSQNEFQPHLSLVYSDIYPIDNALWRTIKTRIQDYLNIDNIDFPKHDFLSWDGGVLKLVLCEGDVEDWVTLGTVDIH